ncbi:MAG: hypothetical protein ACYTBJ_15595, partial [Planctomycetota bacterium]
MKEGTTRRQFMLASTVAGTGIASLAAGASAGQKAPVGNPAREARMAMRRGRWKGTTVYKVPDHVQCNLVVLSHELAYEFLLYCQRNPKACPVIEVTDAGNPEPR